jgi:RNA polymerase sigma factor (sigma-70 family)
MKVTPTSGAQPDMASAAERSALPSGTARAVAHTAVAPSPLARIYSEERDFIARVIQRLCGPGPHVEDLLQETFLTAHRQLSTWSPKRCKASTWLYSIARHLCLRHRRSTLRFGLFHARLQGHATTEAKPADGPERAFERREQLRAVARALDKLSFKQREVFVLFELEEQDGPAIAALLGIPEGTVWTRLQHARRNFDKHMQRQQAKSRERADER